MLISPEYAALNASLHKSNDAYGTSGSLYADDVARFCLSLNARSVLDYGAGKGLMKKSLPATLDVREYDPAIEAISARPEKADIVTCTDVLEHIEPDYLLEVLEDINGLSVRGVFLSVACRPAKKILADGRNAHLIVEKPMWWLGRISACFSHAVIGGVRFDKGNLIAWIGK